jgi:3-hydroxyacyl-CoA dehydrogenase/3a,7a,12a-trihydroxy-5b-cholest-24-enoyl-CoA hydratase
MASGKLNPQKLYFGGKLKISGDVMASQKLDFLQKVDQAKVAAAMKAAGYTPGGGVAAPAAPEGAFVPTASEVFAAIGDYVQNQEGLVAKIGKTFLFKLTDSAWTIDVKNGKGGVTQGAADKPDCTLEISDNDFMDMVAGKADAMKLFSSGKLKISGDVMASQKLTFLQKMDPKRAKEVAMSSRASGGGAAKAATTAAPKEASAKKVFAALGERLAKNPALAAEVKAVLGFKVTGPESNFTVDLSSGAGTIKEGLGQTAATFTIADDDLVDLAKGGDARDLYQRGKLRVDGDVKLATRLSFFKGLVG